MPSTSHHSTEYTFGISASEGDYNPTLTFVLDIEYDYTPAFRGNRDEPPHDATVDMSADLFLLDGAVRLPVPAEVKSWLLKHINLAQFAETCIQEAEDDRERARDAAEEARAEDRHGVRA